MKVKKGMGSAAFCFTTPPFSRKMYGKRSHSLPCCVFFLEKKTSGGSSSRGRCNKNARTHSFLFAEMQSRRFPLAEIERTWHAPAVSPLGRSRFFLRANVLSLEKCVCTESERRMLVLRKRLQKLKKTLPARSAQRLPKMQTLCPPTLRCVFSFGFFPLSLLWRKTGSREGGEAKGWVSLKKIKSKKTTPICLACLPIESRRGSHQNKRQRTQLFFATRMEKKTRTASNTDALFLANPHRRSAVLCRYLLGEGQVIESHAAPPVV